MSYSLLEDGTLVVVGANRDLVDEWERLGSQGGGPAGDPWGVAAKADARVWTQIGEDLIEGPSFPLLRPRLLIDRFPDGQWLVVAGRTQEIGNARVLAPGGEEIRRIHLGDGIGHMQIDRAGSIWVGWFDEGVFGNEDWRLPGFRWPPSADGLAVFDEHGRRIAHAEPPQARFAIADCYALNVAGRTAFACTYTDFPIVCMSEEVQTWTPTDLRGPRALAVRPPYVLAVGGYAEEGDRAVLLKLDGARGLTVGVWRLPLRVGHPNGVEMIGGRGDTIHVVSDGVWLRWTIGEFIAQAKGTPPRSGQTGVRTARSDRN